MTDRPYQREARPRLRVRSVRSEVLPDARIRVRVTLEREGGRTLEGVADGSSLAEGRMRAGAEALLQALTPDVGGHLRLTLRGARTLRAFDSTVVIVALRATAPVPEGEKPGPRTNLIGCVTVEDRDLARGAVLAVLNAANRLLEKPLPSPPSNPPAPSE